MSNRICNRIMTRVLPLLQRIKLNIKLPQDVNRGRSWLKNLDAFFFIAEKISRKPLISMSNKPRELGSDAVRNDK